MSRILTNSDQSQKRKSRDQAYREKLRVSGVLAEKALTTAQRAQEFRIWIFEKAGGKCVKCDWSDWRGLQLDHVNSDGHRDPISRYPRSLKAAEKILARIFSGELQVLCASHNWVKYYECNESRPR